MTQVSWLDYQGGNLGHDLGDDPVCPDRPRAATPQTQVADLVVSGCGRRGKSIDCILHDYISCRIPLCAAAIVAQYSCTCTAITEVLRIIAAASLHLDSFASDLLGSTCSAADTLTCLSDYTPCDIVTSCWTHWCQHLM